MRAGGPILSERPPGRGAPGCEQLWLIDGSTIELRPQRDDDRDGLARLMLELSDRSLAMRFCGAVDRDWAAEWASEPADPDGYALVAIVGEDLVAQAEYATVSSGEQEAEVAFTVADSWQHHGLASHMLRMLARHARANGIVRFSAQVEAGNSAMLSVFRESGFATSMRSDTGIVAVRIAIAARREAAG